MTLMEAIQMGVDSQELIRMVNKRPSALREHQKVRGWFTLPFHEALNSNYHDLELIQCMLDHWPEVMQKKNAFGSTPLHCALSAQCDSATILFLLERSPSSVQLRGRHQSLPLHEAAVHCDDIEVFKALLNAWPEAIYEREATGMTALHCALHMLSRVSVIEFLVQKWPDSVKEVDSEGFLPLHHAIEQVRDSSIVKLLIDQWPESIYYKDQHGLVPFEFATQVAECGSSRRLSYLLDPLRPLHFCCSYSGVGLNLLKFLLCKRPNAADERDKNGRLPLHLAVQGGRLSVLCLEYLLRSNPNAVRAVDQDGQSPIEIAIASHAPITVIELLLEEGNPELGLNFLGKEMLFPVLLAARHDSPLEVIFLLARRWPQVIRAITD